jgi:Phage derived protein Gp49-like (DUF891)
MTFRVDWDQEAHGEVMRLPAAERRAVMNAVAKLEAFGDQLGSPHTSQVKGSKAGLGELRPAPAGHRGGLCTGAWETGWWCWQSAPKPSTTSAGSTGPCAWPRTG